MRNFRWSVNLVMKLFTFIVQLLYMGSHAGTLVKHKTLIGCGSLKKVTTNQKNTGNIANIQKNVYTQSESDRQHRFRVLRQNVNTRSSSFVAGGVARYEGTPTLRPASREQYRTSSKHCNIFKKITFFFQI